MKTINKCAYAGILNNKRSTWHDNIMSAIAFAERGEAVTATEFLDQNKRVLRQKRKTDEKRVVEKYSRRMYS
jgi:hypothetical protein